MWWLPLLALLATAHIPDNTNEHLTHTLHDYSGAPDRTGENFDTPLLINYIMVDSDMTATQELYFWNFVVERTRSYFSRVVFNRALPAPTAHEEYHWAVPEECAGFEIPLRLRWYKVSGNELHIFIFGSKADGNQGSWGAPCAVDADNIDEPIFGAIWINTADFDLHSDADNFHNLIRQTFHVLAMHPLLYPKWKDAGNSFAAWTDPVLETTERDKTPVFKIVTPTVVATAAAMFGCAGLDGVELEESFVNDVPSANWERRIMFNDVLTTGQADNDPIMVSGVSWAVLEDSGWYDVVDAYLLHEINYGNN
jgi:hypothetical protein